MQASRTLKVVLIGDGNAGKTSLRQRYLTDRFQHAYRATIGADFVSKTVDVSVPSPQRTKDTREDDSEERDGSAGLTSASVSSQSHTVRVTVSIWDTAGQERFRSLGTAFYRGADAVVIAFDVTKRGALERTLSWYKDFCSIGDLGMDGDESERSMTTKQLRVARQRRERFCWVAVGCKADLLASKQEGPSQPTPFRQARVWFDRIVPRYLPEGQEEQDVGDLSNVVNESEAKPYTIDGQAPALPADVLSRPSPTNNPHASLLPHLSNESSQSRHPDAGTPPGQAVKPGTGTLLRRQSSTQHLARQTAVLPIDNTRKLSPARPIGHGHSSLSSSSGVAPSTVRSRYDSAVSSSGQSVYYSLRGSTTYSRSSAARSQSTDTTTERDSNSQTTSTDASNEDDDETDTVHEASIGTANKAKGRPTLHKVFSNQSDATATAGARQEKRDGNDDEEEEEQDDDDDDEIRPRRIAPSIPSGEPIPFPTDEDDELSGDVGLTAMSMRHSRTSSRRHSRRLSHGQSNGDSHLAAQTSAELIAEQVKSDRETQADLSVIDKRATLYSARPSSCNSTIRPADADQEEQNDTTAQEHSDASYEDQIEQGFRLFYTSAKDGTSVDQVFEHIARRVAVRWAYEEWEESQRREMWGYDPHGEVRTAPPTDEDRERERMRRAIKISQGKSVGGCCS